MTSLLALTLTCFLVLAGESLAVPVDQTQGVNLLSALRMNFPLFSYTTQTSTLTETRVTTQWLPSVVCARLVNVTGPCRLQPRGQDDNGRIFQMEQPEVLTFDDEMGEADALVQLQPTVTLKVEPTVMPDNLEANSKMRLEASWSDPAHKGEGIDGQSSPGLTDAIRAFFNVVQIERTTSTVQSTTFLPFTTKTIFIMKCTPLPFTVSICSRGPKGPRRD
ncbi:hypothetical protein OUZ56_015896 [Daphnia magna]|uniref:Uncharacterized protein n=1 Tax=Daphnia magna TaxID=35525 RepID=A0ABR0AP35_9CRUS|nr:hypothetical protein OUZ56_015896 [Daphnia magna]